MARKNSDMLITAAFREGIKRGSFAEIEVEGKIDLDRSETVCEACFKGKQARLPLLPSAERASECGELVHFDIFGPMSQPSLTGCRWLAVFVDDYSSFVLVYGLQGKSQIYRVVTLR